MDKRLLGLSIRDLRLLSELPQVSSLRNLARKQGLAPPQVSKILKTLEDALGATLVSRSASGFTLTLAGQHAADTAARICSSLEELQIPPEGVQPAYAREVRVGSRGFLNAMLAPLLVQRFEKESPGTGFTFVDLSPGEKLEAARREALDVLVSVEDLHLGKNWETTEVGTMSWGLYGAADHPLARSACVTSAEVAEHRILRSAWWDGRSVATGGDYVPLPTHSKSHGHRIQTAHVALRMVARSRQLVYVPRLVAQDDVERGHLREVVVEGLEPVSEPVYLSVSLDRVEKRVQKDFESVIASLL